MKNKYDGKTLIKMLQYKPEAVAAFEEMEKRFNETHDDIQSSAFNKAEGLPCKPHSVGDCSPTECKDVHRLRGGGHRSAVILKIESPNEAMTVLKTRLIKEDYPDIVGIGGDINYSNFPDAELFMNISDFEGVPDIKPSYMQIKKILNLSHRTGSTRFLMSLFFLRLGEIVHLLKYI